MARFNGYDIEDAGLKQETSEEKVARLRREIEEVKHDKVLGSENLLDELNCALTKNSEGLVKKSQESSSSSKLEARLAKLERLVGIESAEYTVPLQKSRMKECLFCSRIQKRMFVEIFLTVFLFTESDQINRAQT